MENQKVGEKRENIAITLYFYANRTTGEMIFQQKDKILLPSGIYSNPEYSLPHTLF